MKPRLWRDYHRPALMNEIARTWDEGSTLVFVPPTFKDLSPFRPFLDGSHRFAEPPVFGIFTSGTVGHKLIFYSRRNIQASLDGILSFFDTARIENVYGYPQPFHVFGLVLGYLFSHLYGKPLFVPMGRHSSAAHGNWLKHVNAGTLTLGTPTHFKDLMTFVSTTGAKPPASYSAILGGAPVTRDLWLAVRDTLRIEAPSIGYGASELSPGATHLGPGIVPTQDFEIGRPLPNLSVEIHPGRGMRVRGDNVCLGLVQHGKLHQPTEIWLHDEVRELAPGRMVFCNRTDLLLNRGGEKFFLDQIEQLLKDRLGLDAVSVGVSHPRLGEELGLMIHQSDRTTIRRETIYECLRTEYTKDFDPGLCFFVDELPLSASAKVDRRACRQFIEEQRVSP